MTGISYSYILYSRRKVGKGGKVKVSSLLTGHEDQEYSYTLSLTSARYGDGWSTPRPGRFTPGKDPVPIVQEAGWAPGPVWTGPENLAPTGIQSPERPALSESLYRLSYPGPGKGGAVVIEYGIYFAFPFLLGISKYQDCWRTFTLIIALSTTD
jgi:hypothetical protein